jgi:hypothetical protein
MKTILKIASILTWFNIIFWGVIAGLLLLGSLTSFNPLILALTVLICAVPLNCYAALKLHASIRRPVLPLRHQTPAGIRFVGFIALFFGISWIADGVVLLKNGKDTREIISGQIADLAKQYQQVPQFAQFKNVHEPDVAHIGGLVFLFLGLCVAINVVLNLRLLRWYYLVRKSDAGEKP